MKYLVNRETKEHVIATEGHRDRFSAQWDIVDADSEGWIKHDGKECPLPDGALCDVMFNSSGESRARKSNRFDWSHVFEYSKITHYRPILDDKQRPTADDYLSAADSILKGKREQTYNAQGERNQPDNSDLIDRLRSSHKAASELPDLVSELREVLGEEIMEMLCAKCYESDMASDHEGWCGDEPEPDMTDWRNWRKGDRVICVKVPDEHHGYYVVGGIYFVHSVDPDDERLPVRIFSKPALGLGCEVGSFRFHSRPTKEQDNA